VKGGPKGGQTITMRITMPATDQNTTGAHCAHCERPGLPVPAALRPEELTAIVDTRERAPLDLAPLQTVSAALPTGDYSLRGLEHVVAVERKGLTDLITCVGPQRRRFEREVRRLLAYPVRALVVEAEWSDLELGHWRGQVTPAAAVGSCLGWVAAGLPVLMAGDHALAGQFVSRLVFIAAPRRWREARSLVAAVDDCAAAPQRDSRAASAAQR